MLGQVFSAFGGFIGNLLGGGMISTIARFAGRALGNYIERSSYEADVYYKHKYHLDNIYVTSNTKWKTIPLVFGRARVYGEIIWATPLEEALITDADIKYFKSSKDIKSITHNSSYLYYANFALGICEGEVDKIERIWINGVESCITEYNFRFYKGDEDQLPDQLIEHSYLQGKVPAFRGLCYIIFEKFPLENFGNKIPQFSFEVFCGPKIRISPQLEDDIKNMVIIPGSGEFVYDTKIQEKLVYSQPGGEFLYKEYINYHNRENISDSTLSLNDLVSTCKNLEWVSPVIGWFADNLDAGLTSILPKVEYNDPSSKTTEEWRVSGFSRHNASVITHDKDGIPNYGGTASDESLLSYLAELKSRNLIIMLNPMIFLDLPRKPWRGHITGNPDAIRRFFNHIAGYKNFILHYACLVRGKVDAFVIGSELKSLTKIKEGNEFPAVLELVDLAKKVKAILGSFVTVTYAADWSEYHSDGAGDYHLDELWACDAIDVIGIDAYFPLTDSAESNITEGDIKRGWRSGECFDYYIRDGDKIPLDPSWALKNIEYWWKNSHINKDGKRSPWIPKSKKIWFTELGFPSIDKAPNQPNVFYDPNCSDGGSPKYSNNSIDFDIQRKAIKASLDFWRDSEFIEKIFLWAWDVRPYPFWPHSNAWRDGDLWKRGHWLNGKLSCCNLGNILLELCKRAGINIANVQVQGMSDSIDGIAIYKQTSIWGIISLLRLSYFFDVSSNYSQNIEFIKRCSYSSQSLNMGQLVKYNGDIISIKDVSLDEAPGQITISFLDQTYSYNHNIVRILSEKNSNIEGYYIDLPISMEERFAQNIAEKLMDKVNSEKKFFEFRVLMKDLADVTPGSVVTLSIYGTNYMIRITDMKYHGLLCHVFGVVDEN